MTIHKAKGLEFDTVIVPGLGRLPRGDEARLLLWSERPRSDEDSDLLLAPIKASVEDDDPIYGYLKQLEQDKQRHEDGRLLYVATTRARKRLHLLGHADYTLTDDGPRLRVPAQSTLLRRLWP
ncbi:MAG: 3'-5' exonuclease, partial [Pseudolabrys sp.]